MYPDVGKIEANDNQDSNEKCYPPTADILTTIENPNQLSIATVMALSPNLDFQTEEPCGVVKVESLRIGNSVESLKSVNINSDHSDTVSMDRIKVEKWYSVTLQVSIPFMLAGVGTIGAGIVLGNVQSQEVFQRVSALYILVPSILGLKGNLDMCLASRMSTQANLGNMKSKREFLKMIIGNVGLVQIQAIVAACVVSLFAVCISAIMTGTFDFKDAILLCSAGVTTATLSCFVLDFVLIAVIFSSHRLKMNPDNLATPLAASIGDVVSLLLLSTFAGALYKIHDSHYWLLFVIVAIYLFVFLPFWILIVRKNKYTSSVLSHGWTPVLSALFISGLGGLVLDSAVEMFRGYAVFQPIINGIGGNLVSVQSSRISTMLHQTSLPGILPPHTKHCLAPWTALFGGVVSATTARILILLSIPGQLVFIFVADIMYNYGTSTLSPVFVITYLSVGVTQIMALLYIAHILIHTMWRFKIDPDNSAIPYLTAMGDLLGTSLLLLAFMFLKSIGHEYVPLR